jgi:F0F1-type ATP synthase membrane subunit b/b'
MKKLFLFLAIIASTSIFAQSTDDVILVQSLYGKSKGDIIKDYLNLAEPQATAFQAVYDNYEAERKALGQKKMQIINDYAINYDKITDEKADELAKNNLKNNVDFEKLLSKAYGKAKKAVGPINAAKFIQLEQYFQTTIRSAVQDEIPFIGELEKTKK